MTIKFQTIFKPTEFCKIALQMSLRAIAKQSRFNDGIATGSALAMTPKKRQ